jgi:hypothetical protein
MSATYYQAALQILKDAGRPLTTREITTIAIESGLITPSGKTPGATMSAVLYTRVHDNVHLVKVDTLSNGRTKRGSVRWALRTSDAAND